MDELELDVVGIAEFQDAGRTDVLDRLVDDAEFVEVFGGGVELGPAAHTERQVVQAAAVLVEFVVGHRSQTDQHAAEVTDESWSDHSVDQNPGLLFSATMGYSVPNLPSRFDRVTALLVRLDDGSVVIAAASVPNDAGPELARQAAESLQTLTIR